MQGRMSEWILRHPVGWGVAEVVIYFAVKIALEWGHTTHIKREVRWIAYQASNRATKGYVRKLLG